MANHDVLDDLFSALSDSTRRAVVHRLCRGPATVGELAEPFAIKLPTFLKHIRMLETTGLIHTSKTGRVRTCSLRPEQLEPVADWLGAQRTLWQGRTDRLETLVTNHQEHPQ